MAVGKVMDLVRDTVTVALGSFPFTAIWRTGGYAVGQFSGNANLAGTLRDIASAGPPPGPIYVPTVDRLWVTGFDVVHLHVRHAGAAGNPAVAIRVRWADNVDGFTFDGSDEINNEASPSQIEHVAAALAGTSDRGADTFRRYTGNVAQWEVPPGDATSIIRTRVITLPIRARLLQIAAGTVGAAAVGQAVGVSVIPANWGKK